MAKHVAALAVGAMLAISFVAGAQADTQRVGVTGAVNPAAAGTPPGAATRQLVVGSDVVFRERVITTADGQAQILFLDHSTLMIGPNSTVVIDEFVYDPSSGKGNIAATLTQGSFRYIGGKLSKQGNATLKTPVATIGIRGSDVTVTFDSVRNQTNVVTTHGTANVQTLGGVLGLRTGFGTTVGALDRQLAQATSLTAAQVAATNAIFEGQIGKNAGAGRPPTDADIARSGLGSAIEAQRLASTEPAAGGQSGSGTFTVPFTPGNNDTPQQVLPPPPPPPSTSPSTAAAPPRTDQTLNGYVAGFGLTRDDEVAEYAITNDRPTQVQIRTIPDANGPGRVLAGLQYRSLHGDDLDLARIELGDQPDGSPATRSVFTSDANFLARQLANAGAGKAQVDGYDAGISAVLVTAPNAASFGQFAGQNVDVSLCDCQFVKWGLWTATLDAGLSEGRQIVPLGLWVAGRLPQIGDPSPQGVATFNGTAFGMVRNRSKDYFASGAFTNAYNFNQRTGNVSITNFDGKSFSGTVSAGTDWRSYSGSLSGSRLSGSVNGSFYGNRDAAGQLQVPQETGGNFNVGKHGYSASGIFVGKR